MLLVSNGAYKSGSSWLYFILEKLTGKTTPLLEYQNPDWVHPSIHSDKIPAFLQSEKYVNNHYLVKQHLKGEQLKLFRTYMDGNILFFNIRRDYRDVVVASYYHDIRRGYSGDFNSYYWSKGRSVHTMVRQFHDDYKKLISSEYKCIVDYEGLINNFKTEIEKLCSLLNLDLDEEQVEKIRNETTMKQMKAQSSNKGFFRKGITGDYKNYYNFMMQRDFREIENRTIMKFMPVIAVMHKKFKI